MCGGVSTRFLGIALRRRLSFQKGHIKYDGKCGLNEASPNYIYIILNYDTFATKWQLLMQLHFEIRIMKQTFYLFILSFTIQYAHSTPTMECSSTRCTINGKADPWRGPDAYCPRLGETGQEQGEGCEVYAVLAVAPLDPTVSVQQWTSFNLLSTPMSPITVNGTYGGKSTYNSNLITWSDYAIPPPRNWDGESPLYICGAIYLDDGFAHGDNACVPIPSVTPPVRCAADHEELVIPYGIMRISDVINGAVRQSAVILTCTGDVAVTVSTDDAYDINGQLTIDSDGGANLRLDVLISFGGGETFPLTTTGNTVTARSGPNNININTILRADQGWAKAMNVDNASVIKFSFP